MLIYTSLGFPFTCTVSLSPDAELTGELMGEGVKAAGFAVWLLPPSLPLSIYSEIG